MEVPADPVTMTYVRGLVQGVTRRDGGEVG